MTGIAYSIVDAFTNRPFAGNPAAVVPLPAWRDDTWLQNVAMEMNLSETAFLVTSATGYDLRWFTPQAEVDLCGHATLASALALAHLGKLPDGGSVSFSTRSGILSVRQHGTRFEMDFPALCAEPCDPPKGLIESLNVEPLLIARGAMDYLVEVADEAAVRTVTPDFWRLREVACRGVIVTARSAGPQFDFVSRFFAPAVGVDEDPVTGSAHCLLAPFWGARLGKSQMVGYQLSRRGGTVHVEVRGPRVLLGGDGVLVANGVLAID